MLTILVTRINTFLFILGTSCWRPYLSYFFVWTNHEDEMSQCEPVSTTSGLGGLHELKFSRNRKHIRGHNLDILLFQEVPKRELWKLVLPSKSWGSSDKVRTGRLLLSTIESTIWRAKGDTTPHTWQHFGWTWGTCCIYWPDDENIYGRGIQITISVIFSHCQRHKNFWKLNKVNFIVQHIFCLKCLS